MSSPSRPSGRASDQLRTVTIERHYTRHAEGSVLVSFGDTKAICTASKERLTPIRRRVLEALLASHAPLGAYELIDRLAEAGARPAPITIYRALDFLREQGLVHRIESRNAFIACVHNHASGDPVVFLICEKCGAVGEAASAAVADTIKSASRAAGFTPKTPVIEISGTCAHCKAV